MDINKEFVRVRSKFMDEQGDFFQFKLVNQLNLNINQSVYSPNQLQDRYLSPTTKSPAYYNPNSGTIHVNESLIRKVSPNVLENILYHELAHAASHHAQMTIDGARVLKSGLKIQTYDKANHPITLNRGLNEGFTQYITNSQTTFGPAYRQEVAIIGQLVRKIGLKPFKLAYFGPAINQLEQILSAIFGSETWNEVSHALDTKQFGLAKQIIKKYSI